MVGWGHVDRAVDRLSRVGQGEVPPSLACTGCGDGLLDHLRCVLVADLVLAHAGVHALGHSGCVAEQITAVQGAVEIFLGVAELEFLPRSRRLAPSILLQWLLLGCGVVAGRVNLEQLLRVVLAYLPCMPGALGAVVGEDGLLCFVARRVGGILGLVEELLGDGWVQV